MAHQFYVTGPVHIWFNTNATPGSGSWVYLGTTQVQPQISLQDVYYDVKNDAWGPSLPAQKIVNGQIGQAAVALNQFSHTNLATLRTQCNPAGSRSSADRSTFAMYGGRSVQLGFQCENYDTGGSFPDMPRGWVFYNSIMTGEQELQIGQGKDEIVMLSFECHPYRIISGSTYTWKTYDLSFNSLGNPTLSNS